MKFRAAPFLIAAILSCTTLLPAHAEHSFAAEFDSANRVTVKGIVTKVDWTSPNMFVYVDMKDVKTGKARNWTLEMNCANSLKAGWTRDTLRVGMVVLTSDAPRARDGSYKVHPGSIQIANGPTLDVGR